MKKHVFITLVLLWVLLSGCNSKNSDKTNADSDSVKLPVKHFSPPSWIQGSWVNESGVGFRFKESDICQIAISQESCYGEMLTEYKTDGVKTSSTEDSSQDIYICSYTTGDYSAQFTFQKISENQILWVTGVTNFTLIKQ